MGKKKEIPEEAKFTYLGNIIHLHSIYENMLTEKTGFLVAVAAIVLTVCATLMLGADFSTFPMAVQLAIITPCLGAALCVVLSISAERTDNIKRVTTFHPLSITEFHDEARQKFSKDIAKVLGNEVSVIDDYSAQILHMKEAIYTKNRNIKWAMNLLIFSLFGATLFICVQLFIFLFL